MANINVRTGDNVDPQKEEREGKVREVGCQAVWSLSSCKPGAYLITMANVQNPGVFVADVYLTRASCKTYGMYVEGRINVTHLHHTIFGFGVEQLRDNCLETYWQSDGPQPHLVNVQFRRKTTLQDVCIYADYKLDESYTPNRISIRAGSHFHDLQEVEVVELNEPSGWVLIPLRDANERPIRTFLVQIAVLSNHQNGRDTHMRQIKVHSPVQNICMSALKLPPFSSIECSSYSCIR